MTTYQDGEAAYEHNDYEIAIEIFRILEENDIENGEINEWVARCYLKLKKYEDALAEAQIAIQKTPDLPIAHLLLGNIYAMEKQFPESVGELKTALEIDPNLHEAYLTLGTINIMQGQHRLAIDFYWNAFRRFPSGKLLLYIIRDIYIVTKNWLSIVILIFGLIGFLIRSQYTLPLFIISITYWILIGMLLIWRKNKLQGFMCIILSVFLIGLYLIT